MIQEKKREMYKMNGRNMNKMRCEEIQNIRKLMKNGCVGGGFMAFDRSYHPSPKFPFSFLGL